MISLIVDGVHVDVDMKVIFRNRAIRASEMTIIEYIKRLRIYFPKILHTTII